MEQVHKELDRRALAGSIRAQEAEDLSNARIGRFFQKPTAKSLVRFSISTTGMFMDYFEPSVRWRITS